MFFILKKICKLLKFIIFGFFELIDNIVFKKLCRIVKVENNLNY